MVLYLLFFCLCLKVPLVYPLVCFWVSLKVPFSNIFLCLPIKKKKKKHILRLQGKRVHREEEDRVIWIESKSGKLSIKALYIVLESGSSVSFSVGVIWNSWVLPNVGFFAWEATQGKVVTLDQL